jgi:hypothetical protein
MLCKLFNSSRMRELPILVRPERAHAQASCIEECEAEYNNYIAGCEVSCPGTSNPDLCMSACQDAAQNQENYCYEGCVG